MTAPETYTDAELAVLPEVAAVARAVFAEIMAVEGSVDEAAFAAGLAVRGWGKRLTPAQVARLLGFSEQAVAELASWEGLEQLAALEPEASAS